MEKVNDKRPIKQGEMLTTTTVRIECILDDNRLSIGTGFFYSLEIDNDYIPLIITNKHVIAGALKLRLVFTKADTHGNRLNDHIRFEIPNFTEAITDHPDETVDLCAISISYILEKFRESNIEIHTYFVNSKIIPTKADFEKMDAIEEVLVVGYPKGLWDSKNNQPLVRKGITSTSPKIDYRGKKEFLIDAAVFPGSSGSPVFFLDKTYKTQITDDLIAHKVLLLGVLYSGPTQLLEGTGEIVAANIHTSTPAMLNLGTVINAERILELEAQIRSVRL